MKRRSRYRANKMKLYVSVPDKEAEEAVREEIKRFLHRIKKYSGGRVDFEYEIDVV